MENERRKYPRYRIYQMIKISFEKMKYISYNRGIDISKSGLLCEINQNLPVGTEVYLIIAVPMENEEKKIELQAKVVRSQPVEFNKFHVALEFIFIETVSKQYLYKYIDNIATD